MAATCTSRTDVISFRLLGINGMHLCPALLHPSKLRPGGQVGKVICQKQILKAELKVPSLSALGNGSYSQVPSQESRNCWKFHIERCLGPFYPVLGNSRKCLC